MLTDVFVNKKTSGYSGNIIEKLKTIYADSILDSTFIQSINKIKNTITSFMDNTISSIVPIGLSIGALFTGTQIGSKPAVATVKGGFLRKALNTTGEAIRYLIRPLGKYPIIGKICAGLLVAYGVTTATTNVLGLHKKSEL